MPDSAQDSFDPVPKPAAHEAISARVHAAFDALVATAASAPRPGGALGAQLRRPLGQLVATAQMRDMFDQRLSHIVAAETGAAGRDATTRAAAGVVAARLLSDLADLVDGAGGAASVGFLTVSDMAEECEDPEIAAALRHAAEDGQGIADALLEAGGQLAALAEARQAGIDAGVPGEAIARADLGWLEALYTMEDERQSHATAIAALRAHG
jgi:hypothetical protein